MIQRIQSLYLILTSLFQGLGLVFYPNRLLYNGEAVLFSQHFLMLVILVLLTTVPTLVVFLFKKRQLQFVLNRLLILATLLVWAVHVVGYVKLEATASSQMMPMLIYLLNIVLLVLANKAIKRDEDLVRAADRIR